MEVKDLFEKALADEEYHLILNKCGEYEEILYLVDKHKNLRYQERL